MMRIIEPRWRTENVFAHEGMPIRFDVVMREDGAYVVVQHTWYHAGNAVEVELQDIVSFIAYNYGEPTYDNVS